MSNRVYIGSGSARRLSTRLVLRTCWGLFGCLIGVGVLSGCSVSGADAPPQLRLLQDSGGLVQYQQPCQEQLNDLNRNEPPAALGGDEYTVAELRSDPDISDSTKGQISSLTDDQVVLMCVMKTPVGSDRSREKNVLIGFWSIPDSKGDDSTWFVLNEP